MAWFFVVLFVLLGIFGVWCTFTKHFPVGEEVFEYKDMKVKISNLGVLLAFGSFLTAYLILPDETARSASDAGTPSPALRSSDATPNPPVISARAPQKTGPWQDVSNDVVLSVTEAYYKEDHTPEIQLRWLNTNGENRVAIQWDTFVAFDSMGRTRTMNASQSTLDGDPDYLSPGNSITERIRLNGIWWKDSTHFSACLTYRFEDGMQRFSVCTPGIPIPKEQRLG